MASALFVPPRHAHPAPADDARLAGLADGRCTVTLTLDDFHNFGRKAMRFDRRLAFRVVRDVGRPIDLLRLMFGTGLDAPETPPRLTPLAARDAGLHLNLRHVALQWLPDRSYVWIYSNGFAVSGPRRPLDIASFLNFRADRIRFVKPIDLEDCIEAFGRLAKAAEGPSAGMAPPAHDPDRGRNPQV